MTCFSIFGPSGTASTLREGDAGRHTHYRRARRLPSFRSAGATADRPSAEPDNDDDETDEREDRRDDTARDDDGHRSTGGGADTGPCRCAVPPYNAKKGRSTTTQTAVGECPVGKMHACVRTEP